MADQESKMSLGRQLFLLPVIFPLALILAGFVFGVWSWGLMDDIGWIVAPEKLWESFLTETSYRMRPLFWVHVSAMVHSFGETPRFYFLFRWVEVLATLAVWGGLVYHLTRRWWAAFLFVGLTFTLERFFDSFFYLPLQEVQGLFFVGLALFVMFSDPRGQISRSWGRFLAAFVLFVIAVLYKETFLACPLALGLVLVGISCRPVFDPVRCLQGGGLFLAFFAYALFLKFCIARVGYSSEYVVSVAKLTADLWGWVLHTLPYHIPGIILCGLAFLTPRSSRIPSLRAVTIFGALLYGIYLVILLPWQATGHYTIPLGIFAAFLVTVIAVPRIENWSFRSLAVLAAVLFVLTGAISAKAFYFHQTYQYDTVNLLEWMRDNALFRHELEAGANVRANALEPSDRIPVIANHMYGTAFAPFGFTANVRDIVADPQTRYFLWGPVWGNQDLRRLGNKLLWYPVFTSKHWVMFRRAY